MKSEFQEMLEDSTIIPAIRDMSGLKACLKSDSKVIFILFGDIMTIADIVEQIKKAGKLAMVHIDLISGLSSKEISVSFIKNKTKADGIISTKQNLIKCARDLGLYTIMRFFVIDSMALENLDKQVQTIRPDCVEVLPGVMPKIIAHIHKNMHKPLIAGGLISDKEDVMAALKAGALAVSVTKEDVWFL